MRAIITIYLLFIQIHILVEMSMFVVFEIKSKSCSKRVQGIKNSHKHTINSQQAIFILSHSHSCHIQSNICVQII